MARNEKASRLLTRRDQNGAEWQKAEEEAEEEMAAKGGTGPGGTGVVARRFAALQKIALARIISITALEKRDLVEEP